MLKILAGIEHSDRGGEVKFMKDIRVAFLDQTMSFNPQHTVFEHVYHTMGDLSPEIGEYEAALSSGDSKRIRRAIAAMDASGAGVSSRIYVRCYRHLRSSARSSLWTSSREARLSVWRSPV